MEDYLGVFGNHESWGDQEAFWDFFYVEFFNIHRTPLQEQKQLIEDGRLVEPEGNRVVETTKQWKVRRFRVSRPQRRLFTCICHCTIESSNSLLWYQDVKNWFYTRIEESDTESDAENEHEASGGLEEEGQTLVAKAAEPGRDRQLTAGAKD